MVKPKKLKKEIPKHITKAAEMAEVVRDPMSPPIDLSGADAVDILAAAINAMSAPGVMNAADTAAHLEALFSHDAAGTAFVGMVPDMVFASMSMLGTHNPKIPDPLIGGSPLWATLARSGSTPIRPFMTSASVHLRRPLWGAGNAAQTRAMRLLTSAVRIGDGDTTVAEALADAEGPLPALLRRLGVPRGALEDLALAVGARMTDVPAGRLEPAAKAMFFPIDQGSYHLLSPLHGDGLGFEVRCRIDERQEKGQRVTCRYRRVGGSKPQNAGLLASTIAGRLPCLTGNPPSGQTDRTRDLLFRLQRSGTLVRPRRLDTTAFDRIIANTAWSNIDARAALDRTIAALLFDLADDLTEFADIVAEDNGLRGRLLDAKAFGKVSAWERSFLAGTAGKDIAEFLADALVKALKGCRMKTALSDALLDNISRVADTVAGRIIGETRQ